MGSQIITYIVPPTLPGEQWHPSNGTVERHRYAFPSPAVQQRREL